MTIWTRTTTRASGTPRTSATTTAEPGPTTVVTAAAVTEADTVGEAVTASAAEPLDVGGRSEEGAAAACLVQIFERHGGTVLGLCRALLRNEHEAEDAAPADVSVRLPESAERRRAASPGCLAGDHRPQRVLADQRATDRGAERRSRPGPVRPADGAAAAVDGDRRASAASAGGAAPPRAVRSFVFGACGPARSDGAGGRVASLPSAAAAARSAPGCLRVADLACRSARRRA